MKHALRLAWVALGLLIACGAEPPPAPQPKTPQVATAPATPSPTRTTASPKTKPRRDPSTPEPTTPQRLSKPPDELLLGSWIGDHVEHVPHERREAANAIGRATWITFTRTTMTTTLESLGEQSEAYEVTARTPLGLTLTRGGMDQAKRSTTVTFRGDNLLVMPLSGKATLVMRRAQSP